MDFSSNWPSGFNRTEKMLIRTPSHQFFETQNDVYGCVSYFGPCSVWGILVLWNNGNVKKGVSYGKLMIFMNFKGQNHLVTSRSWGWNQLSRLSPHWGPQPTRPWSSGSSRLKARANLKGGGILGEMEKAHGKARPVDRVGTCLGTNLGNPNHLEVPIGSMLMVNKC